MNKEPARRRRRTAGPIVEPTTSASRPCGPGGGDRGTSNADRSTTEPKAATACCCEGGASGRGRRGFRRSPGKADTPQTGQSTSSGFPSSIAFATHARWTPWPQARNASHAAPQTSQTPSDEDARPLVKYEPRDRKVGTAAG